MRSVGKLHFDQFWAVFFTLSFVLSVVVIITEPASALTSGDFEYQLINSDTEVEITGYTGSRYNMNVVIPNTIDGKPVVCIGRGVFSYNMDITSVYIPDGVKSIGIEAFYVCTHLTSVYIPDSVTSIGDQAFVGCTSLTSVTIPDSVTSIGIEVFPGCTSLTSVYIPDGVTSIGRGAFGLCTSLSSINVSPGNPSYASVDGVLFNKSLTALLQCPGATGSYTIPDSVTIIGDYAFSGCTSLTSVIIPDSVTSIGVDVFRYCTSPISLSFLGLVSPPVIDINWLHGASAELRGHAYNASNFPAPGSTFYGLIMGQNLVPIFPSAPTDLNASLNNTQIVLIWSVPDDCGSSTITGYKLYRSDVINGSFTLIASTSGLDYYDTDTTNGHTYWYKVSAVNALGEGAPCYVISVEVPQSSSSGNNNTVPIIGVIIAMVVMAALAMAVYMRRKRK
jgi:hypothetical protein